MAAAYLSEKRGKLTESELKDIRKVLKSYQLPVCTEGLGKDNDVDLLALGFSSLDYMNRDFGVYAREFQDMVLRMDKDIQRLLEFLDSKATDLKILKYPLSIRILSNSSGKLITTGD